MRAITVRAIPERVDDVIAFIDKLLEEHGCDPQTQTAIDVAADEILSNIAHYAYATGTGDVTVQMDVTGNPAFAVIRFMDRGKPYNPLEKADPDTTLSLEDRQIGGLGIFVVKNSVDDIHYEYRDEKNILTVRKRLRA